MPLSPCCHFERKREIFFVCDRSRHGRTADNGKHRTPCDVGSRCFMQTALRRKTEMGSEKDPSAVIGQAKRGKAHLTDHEVCIGSCTRGRLEDLAIAGEIASVRGWASHFRGGVSSESVLPPCFLRCALISHYFFPRRRSPVIMDRDSITGGQLCHRVLCRKSPVRNAGRRRLSSYGTASIR